MNQSRKTKSAASRFSPAGELTIYTAADNKTRLMQALNGQTHLDVDLSQVSDMDSAGLQLLILARQESQRKNVQLSFIGHSKAVLEVLDMCNLSSVFGDPVVFPFAETERRKSS